MTPNPLDPPRRVVQPPTLAPDDPGVVRDDDELGLQLAPEVEEASRRNELEADRPTGPWPPASPARPGHVPEVLADFGRYELLGEIGRGGMGVVYKARQKGLDRTVAVKMILGSHLAGPEQVERFYAEARAAARLRDPHVVAIHDVGQIHGQHYFAMEFVDGPSLAEKLSADAIAPRDAAGLVATVARAVDRLHQRGIVHRDLKPSNILLDRAGCPFVTDFGLAKMFGGEGNHTRTGAIVGTPGYMAPEQAAARAGDVGPRSDVYSLGAILYETLAGRPPFDEKHPLDTLVQVLEGEPIPPSRIRPDVPRTLERICLKCLEKAPGDRYASAEALADDLDRFVAGESVEARNLGVVTSLRRWARREPALVSRLSVMAISAAVVQSDRFLREDIEAILHRRIMVVLVLGAVASLSFQGLLKSARWSSLARFAWATSDVILFTSLVLLNDGLSTSLVAGYFLLVAASGLWFRERLVWYTTGLTVAAYGLLAAVASARGRSESNVTHLHVLFMTLLAVSGLIIGYQVRRVRALSLYYENRPLP